MQITLEALIAALLRLGAIAYACTGLVSVVAMTNALSALSKLPGGTPGLAGTIVSSVAVHLVLAAVFYFGSLPIARFVCSGLDELAAEPA